MNITPLKFVLFALGTALLTGCAQSPNSLDRERGRASSYSDTLDHVRGRGSIHAPAQIQVGLGEQQTRAQNAPSQDRELIESRQVRELLEPRTFLGTIPCPNTDSLCQPVRVSITLAPAGLWRLRAANARGPANAPGSANEHLAQGCWYRIGSEPTRIVLTSPQDTIVGNFSFLHDWQLLVNSFNQYRPLLETHLTRQRDIDPVSELDNQPAPHCTGFEAEDYDFETQEELILPEL